MWAFFLFMQNRFRHQSSDTDRHTAWPQQKPLVPIKLIKMKKISYIPPDERKHIFGHAKHNIADIAIKFTTVLTNIYFVLY